MSWQNEMVRIVRYIINDLDSSSYTYSDDRLEETLLVSAQLVLQEIDFENTYTVEVDSLDLSPDPTTLADKDDAFINLVSLKTSCLILSSEVRTHSLNAVRISDGPSSVDMNGVLKGFIEIHKILCEKYEQAKLEYKAGNSIAGQAILSPYSPGSDTVGRWPNTASPSRGGPFI